MITTTFKGQTFGLVKVVELFHPSEGKRSSRKAVAWNVVHPVTREWLGVGLTKQSAIRNAVLRQRLVGKW